MLGPPDLFVPGHLRQPDTLTSALLCKLPGQARGKPLWGSQATRGSGARGAGGTRYGRRRGSAVWRSGCSRSCSRAPRPSRPARGAHLSGGGLGGAASRLLEGGEEEGAHAAGRTTHRRWAGKGGCNKALANAYALLGDEADLLERGLAKLRVVGLVAHELRGSRTHESLALVAGCAVGRQGLAPDWTARNGTAGSLAGTAAHAVQGPRFRAALGAFTPSCSNLAAVTKEV